MAVGTWEDVVLARRKALLGRVGLPRRAKVDALDEAVRFEAATRRLEALRRRDEVLLLQTGIRPSVFIL